MPTTHEVVTGSPLPSCRVADAPHLCCTGTGRGQLTRSASVTWITAGQLAMCNPSHAAPASCSAHNRSRCRSVSSRQRRTATHHQCPSQHGARRITVAGWVSRSWRFGRRNSFSSICCSCCAGGRLPDWYQGSPAHDEGSVRSRGY